MKNQNTITWQKYRTMPHGFDHWESSSINGVEASVYRGQSADGKTKGLVAEFLLTDPSNRRKVGGCQVVGDSQEQFDHIAEELANAAAKHGLGAGK